MILNSTNNDGYLKPTWDEVGVLATIQLVLFSWWPIWRRWVCIRKVARCSKLSRRCEARCEGLPGKCVCVCVCVCVGGRGIIGGRERGAWRPWQVGLCQLWEADQARRIWRTSVNKLALGCVDSWEVALGWKTVEKGWGESWGQMGRLSWWVGLSHLLSSVCSHTLLRRGPCLSPLS